ncbi:cytochrome P450 [Irpex rosettiformis]|uniref:Cytochrome P450 n=1 Tax=Irpex rosettiformis TaxID=378272 RepID=A0ACB8UFF7_9APHY|nr:cytochrome P450 [Irpex rosettiformis]
MIPLCILVGVLACSILIRLVSKKRNRLPLPPGPPADPIIGHLRTLPDNHHRAEVFHEWSLKYGDVFSLRVPGKTMIILNSEKAASDLLEKRSVIYSDRLRFGYFDAIGWGDTLAFVRYGPLHTQQRKMYHEALGKHVVSEYWNVQEQESNTLLKGLLDQPKAYDKQVQRYRHCFFRCTFKITYDGSSFAGGIVTEISYGHRIKSFDDKFFLLSEKWARIAHEGSRATLLDVHPICMLSVVPQCYVNMTVLSLTVRYLPSWFPGAWYIDFIKETKPTMDMIAVGNYHKVEEQMKNGTARPSFLSKHLEAIFSGESSPEILPSLRFSSASIFVGGAETTWHSVTTFIACMLLHPEVQKKAQEEIDRVIGRDRLPDFNDRDSLPYINCVLHETLRWQPVLPIGLPHQSTAEDIYNGMRIPKGSIVEPYLGRKQIP